MPQTFARAYRSLNDHACNFDTIGNSIITPLHFRHKDLRSVIIVKAKRTLAVDTGRPEALKVDVGLRIPRNGKE